MPYTHTHTHTSALVHTFTHHVLDANMSQSPDLFPVGIYGAALNSHLLGRGRKHTSFTL